MKKVISANSRIAAAKIAITFAARVHHGYLHAGVHAYMLIITLVIFIIDIKNYFEVTFNKITSIIFIS